MNEQSGGDRGDECISEEVRPAKDGHDRNSEIVYDVENRKNKKSEVSHI